MDLSKKRSGKPSQREMPEQIPDTPANIAVPLLPSSRCVPDSCDASLIETASRGEPACHKHSDDSRACTNVRNRSQTAV